MFLLALCAPEVSKRIVYGWFTRASLMFRAEFSAFEAMFAMFIRNVAVVLAWDPGVDQR